MSRRAQWTLAIVLLSVFAFLLTRELTREESLLGPRGKRGEVGAVPFEAAAVPVVVLASPGALPDESFERERVDIFRYEESPAVAEERRRREEEEAEKRRKAAEEARIKAAEDARRREAERLAELERKRAEEARKQRERDAQRRDEIEVEKKPGNEVRPDPPEFPYRFDGLIGPKANAIAILLDKEDDRHYAQAGQVVDEAFRVERVGQLKLVLSFTDPLFEGEFRNVPLRMEDEGRSTARPTARR